MTKGTALLVLLGGFAAGSCYASNVAPDGGEPDEGGCRSDLECSDDDPCNGAERCRPDGTCVPGVPPLGAVPCSDGDPCTRADACSSGVCVPGTRIVCDDGDPCTTDSCAEGDGSCVHAPAPNFFRDADGDGWGADGEGICADSLPPGYAARAGDCCDTDPAVYPNPAEPFLVPAHDTPYVCAPGDAPSFDYNCDGVESVDGWGLGGLCVLGSWGGPAWREGFCPEGGPHPECRGVPPCGESGAYQFDCSCAPPADGGAADAGSGGASSLDAGLDGALDPDADDLDDALVPKECDCPVEVIADDTVDDTAPDMAGWVCEPELVLATASCR